MTKTHIVETVEEFDENGALLKRTVTETDETDENPVRYTFTSQPYTPLIRSPRDILHLRNK